MNRTTQRTRWLGLTLGLGLLAGALPARAASYTWTGSGANDNWSTSGNWSGATPPPAAADSALFNNNDVNNTNVVDTTRAIAGTTYSNTTGQHYTDLSGNTLTNTGNLYVGEDVNGPSKATLQNGTLLLGSSGTPVDWRVGGRTANNGIGAVGTLSLSNLTVSAVLNSFTVGHDPAFNNQLSQNGTLNINSGSAVTITATNVSIGVGFASKGTVVVASNATFNVTSSTIQIGSHDWNLAAGATAGTLDLSAASASTLTAGSVKIGMPVFAGGSGVSGTLLLGASSLTATNVDVGGTGGTAGTLTSAAGSTVQIQPGGSLGIARASSANATLTIGTGSTLNFGTGPSGRADFTVGQDTASGGGDPHGLATINGSMSGYLGSLAVGTHNFFQNFSAAHGTLDTTGATQLNLDVTGIAVGTNFNSQGTITFGRGTVTAGTIIVGEVNTISGFDSGTAKGFLSMSGTVVRVTNLANIQAKGEVDTHVLTTSAGLDLTNSSSGALSISSFVQTSGGLEISFDANPIKADVVSAANANAIFYGLKWAGNHTNDLLAFWRGADTVQGNSDDKLRWYTNGLVTPFSTAVGLFYDPASGAGLHSDATYIGFYMFQIPEPSAVLLGVAGGLLLWRRVRRR